MDILLIFTTISNKIKIWGPFGAPEEKRCLTNNLCQVNVWTLLLLYLRCTTLHLRYLLWFCGCFCRRSHWEPMLPFATCYAADRGKSSQPQFFQRVVFRRSAPICDLIYSLHAIPCTDGPKEMKCWPMVTTSKDQISSCVSLIMQPRFQLLYIVMS